MSGSITRRSFLSGGSAAAGAILADRCAAADALGPPDITLRIARVAFEVAPGRTIHTTGYNGAVPGPLVRLREGVPVTVEIFNDTPATEFVHWHGFDVPIAVDGVDEECSPGVPAHGSLRYQMTPVPSGSRYVHTHAMAMGDLGRGTFSGQFAFAFVEPKSSPGRYDREVFLAIHEWEPYLASMEQPEDISPAPRVSRPNDAVPMPQGLEVRYRYFTINSKCFGYGEPVRVREGQTVLCHFLNASATESVRFALPGHRFEVVALDGNPVPRPASVETLELGTAERINAIVKMDHPGVFVLGSPEHDRRAKGMGIVVEYAGRSGSPVRVKPAGAAWDYAIFGESRAVAKPAAAVPLSSAGALSTQPASKLGPSTAKVMTPMVGRAWRRGSVAV